MKLSRYKLLLVFPALALSSCGYGLKQTYKGVPYNSTVFAENYYNVWNNDINPFAPICCWTADFGTDFRRS